MLAPAPCRRGPRAEIIVLSATHLSVVSARKEGRLGLHVAAATSGNFPAGPEPIPHGVE